MTTETQTREQDQRYGPTLAEVRAATPPHVDASMIYAFLYAEAQACCLECFGQVGGNSWLIWTPDRQWESLSEWIMMISSERSDFNLPIT